MSVRARLAQTIERLRVRKGAYQRLPQGVLRDLARFCRAFESCVVPGDRDLTLILEGRREVWLRVMQHQHLTPEELAALYRAAITDPTGEHDE